MAPKATIFKVKLAVADVLRGYYQDHVLTLARHPSENDMRMLMRVVVFALNASEFLKFGKGVSSAEEPDLWEMDLTGAIQHWIDLGQPTEKRIRQACGKASRVSIYTYQPGAAMPWFDQVRDELKRFRHLRVAHLAVHDEAALARIVDRHMDLSCTIQEGQVMLANASDNLMIDFEVVKEFA